MESFEIRKAQICDIEGIMQIENESFNKNIVEDRETFLKRIETFNDGFFLLYNQKEICGYFSSELWNEIPNDSKSFALNHSIEKSHKPEGDVLYISSIAVKKKFRGQKLGKLMFEECVSKIQHENKNIKRQVLIVNELWSNAISIYKDNGFVEYGRAENFFPCEDSSFSAGIMMRK